MISRSRRFIAHRHRVELLGPVQDHRRDRSVPRHVDRLAHGRSFDEWRSGWRPDQDRSSALPERLGNRRRPPGVHVQVHAELVEARDELPRPPVEHPVEDPDRRIARGEASRSSRGPGPRHGAPPGTPAGTRTWTCRDAAPACRPGSCRTRRTPGFRPPRTGGCRTERRSARTRRSPTASPCRGRTPEILPCPPAATALPGRARPRPLCRLSAARRWRGGNAAGARVPSSTCTRPLLHGRGQHAGLRVEHAMAQAEPALVDPDHRARDVQDVARLAARACTARSSPRSRSRGARPSCSRRRDPARRADPAWHRRSARSSRPPSDARRCPFPRETPCRGTCPPRPAVHGDGL